MPFNSLKLLSRRIPLIKFTHGGSRATQEASTQQKETLKSTKEAKELQQNQNLLEFFQIPTKYARRLLTNEEIESVNVRFFDSPRYNKFFKNFNSNYFKAWWFLLRHLN
jgi:hypothetical protein